MKASRAAARMAAAMETQTEQAEALSDEVADMKRALARIERKLNKALKLADESEGGEGQDE